MFKLSNANGKFDIVFSQDLHTEENAARGVVVSTSASRRKYKEAKSKVIPKNVKTQPIDIHLKTNKASELRKNLSKDIQINETLRCKKEINETLNTETSNKKSPPIKLQKKIKNRTNTEYEEKAKNLKNVKNTFPNKEVVNERGNTDDKSSFITKDKLDSITQFIQSSKELNVQSKSTSRDNEGNEIMSQKNEEIYKHPIISDTEYNPWGKPGGGAPLKNGNGRINKKISANNNEHIKTSISKDSTNSSLNPTAMSENKAENLNEADKKRLKLLEHQKAIEKQVEEKLRLKKMEQERRQQEDQKAEIRFLREQEMLKIRQDAEENKQRLKEAEMRKHQEQLVESIRLAEEEAIKLRIVKKKKETNKSQGNAAKEADILDSEIDSVKIEDQENKSYNKEHSKVESDHLKTNQLHQDGMHLTKNTNVEKEILKSNNKGKKEKKFTSETKQRENVLFENNLESFPSIFSSVFGNENNSLIQNKDNLFESSPKKQGGQNLPDRYSNQDSQVVQHQIPPLSNPSIARKEEILSQLQLLREGLLKRQLQYYDNVIT